MQQAEKQELGVTRLTMQEQHKEYRKLQVIEATFFFDDQAFVCEPGQVGGVKAVFIISKLLLTEETRNET